MSEQGNGQQSAPTAVLPRGLVPTPTMQYAEFRAGRASSSVVDAAPQAGPKPIPVPFPPLPPNFFGTRVLIWKQDPSVPEIGIRKTFLPGATFTGPKDARIESQGLPPVAPNALGDYIISPADVDAFDAVHTFAVVRQTLTLFERLRGLPIPWAWNGPGNTTPISVFAHAGITMNAFYSRNDKALKFFAFTKPGDPPSAPLIFTCRSLDIVSHECGHAILDGLKPNWLGAGPPQTGGLHESFGDLCAIFSTLSQMDQVEAIIAQTKARLHDKNFLSDMAEQFGLALGRPNGLRNADNDLKLSEVGTEVHAISQVFTGGVYDVLADIFAFERRPASKDDARVLYEVGQYLAGVVLRALIAAPVSAATFADVVNQMRAIVVADGKPAQYRQFITNRFAFREVVSPSSLTLAAFDDDAPLPAGVVDDEGAVVDLKGTCGTMNLAYRAPEETLESELAELEKAFSSDPLRK